MARRSVITPRGFENCSTVPNAEYFTSRVGGLRTDVLTAWRSSYHTAISQHSEYRNTGGVIDAPQPLRLRQRDAEARHLGKLGLDNRQQLSKAVFNGELRLWVLDTFYTQTHDSS
jgi:hypothetical protein